MSIVTEANSLMEQIHKLHRISDEELNRISQPLFAALKDEGMITVEEAERAFVEAQGVWEFDQIPICVGPDRHLPVLTAHGGNVKYSVGKQRVPLHALCGQWHEILREWLGKTEVFCVVVGSRDHAQRVCDELNNTVSDRLPTVLVFEKPQSSISVHRALKNVREVLTEVATDIPDEGQFADRVQVALDDLELMIGAVK
jgi:hypothetical protein